MAESRIKLIVSRKVDASAKPGLVEDVCDRCNEPVMVSQSGQMAIADFGRSGITVICTGCVDEGGVSGVLIKRGAFRQVLDYLKGVKND